MLNWKDPIKSQCADKYAMRSFVQKAGLGHLLPESYGVYESTADIPFDSLPERFVLKCTHGCKSNVFCRDRSQFNRAEAVASLNRWLQIDFGTHDGEPHYSLIPPRVLCEEFLDDGSGDLPMDYKVMCSWGKVLCVMVCTRREKNGNAKYLFLDSTWTKSTNYVIDAMRADNPPERPRNYTKMFEAAQILSTHFPFVRVDFYSIADRVLLGELTFTPTACVSSGYMNHHSQQELGAAVKFRPPGKDPKQALLYNVPAPDGAD